MPEGSPARQQRKASVSQTHTDVIPRGTQVPDRAGSRTSQLQPPGLASVKDTRVKGLRSLPPKLRRAARPGVWQGSSWMQAGRPLHKAVKNRSLDCRGDPRGLELPALWDVCQGELQTGRGDSPRERSAWQSDKLEGKRHCDG